MVQCDKNCMIIVAVVVILVLWYLYANSNSAEGFQRYDRGRTNGYRYNRRRMPINRGPHPNLRVNDSWYGPVQRYFDVGMNGYGVPADASTCIVPAHVNPYCVNQQMSIGVTPDEANRTCMIPASTSESCVYGSP
jgi:hypothetical protein